MQKETILLAPIQSTRLTDAPGDTRQRLTADARTVGGATIPAGTIFQPQSFGFDNVRKAAVRHVVIQGSGEEE